MSKSTLCLLLLLFAASPALAQKAPKIRASETGWNFGERVQGDKDVKKVTIFNDGDAPLKIHDIKITCGCVKGVLVQREIAPGESAELELVLTTVSTVGKIRKHCYIYSNDPKMSQLVLTVEGEVKGDWQLEKPQINFGSCEAGVPYSQKLKVLQRPGQHLEMLKVECLDPNVKVTYEPFADEKASESGWILDVSVLETAPSGPFAAAVAVRTNHRLTPLQNLMVYAKIDGPVKTQPLGKLHMGRIFEGTQATRSLRVTIDDGAGYVVTGVKSDCPAIEATMTELEPGRTWGIDVVVTGRAGDSNMAEALTISTSHPLQREIKMAVNWVTRPMTEAK